MRDTRVIEWRHNGATYYWTGSGWDARVSKARRYHALSIPDTLSWRNFGMTLSIFRIPGTGIYKTAIAWEPLMIVQAQAIPVPRKRSLYTAVDRFAEVHGG